MTILVIGKTSNCKNLIKDKEVVGLIDVRLGVP